MSRKIGVALGLLTGVTVGIGELGAAERLDTATMDGIVAGAVQKFFTRQTGTATGPNPSVSQSTTITGSKGGYQVQQSQAGSADGASASQSQGTTCTNPCGSTQTTQDAGSGGQVNLTQSYTTDPPPPPRPRRPTRVRLPWILS